MFRRYRRRILNCTNRIRRWITGREGTLGNSIEDNNQQEINPDVSIREIAKEHCKKVEKTLHRDLYKNAENTKRALF